MLLTACPMSFMTVVVKLFNSPRLRINIAFNLVFYVVGQIAEKVDARHRLQSVDAYYIF